MVVAVMLAVMVGAFAVALCVWAPDKIIRTCLALPFREVATEALVAKCYGKSSETCETPTCSNKDSDRPTRHTFRMVRMPPGPYFRQQGSDVASAEAE